MCVELYQQGKWPETPTGISEHSFRVTIQKWARIEKACGSEALRHKNQNKVWTAEEKWLRKFWQGHQIEKLHLQQESATDSCTAGLDAIK